MKPCNQCGKCCQQYADGGLSATADEVAWWETFRPEIARYVRGGNIWVDPDTGTALAHCPWLQPIAADDASSPTRYACQIYHDRPQDCRDYPINLDQMVTDGCEMIELRDLDNPEKSQRALQQLLS